MWLQRNKGIFDAEFVQVKSVIQSRRRHQLEALYAKQKVVDTTAPPMGWYKVVPWYKLNVDSARNPLNGLTVCGGAIWDENGQWIYGYAKMTRCCSIVDVELWGAYKGLGLVSSMNVQQFYVETDCKGVWNLLKQEAKMDCISPWY
ncbi:uncharacterized protein LOC120133966 [Hibiscus syriacus]|nr:uncharacterized protein LOC120133966 [Hibiscus syriacus]